MSTVKEAARRLLALGIKLLRGQIPVTPFEWVDASSVDTDEFHKS